VTRLVRERVAPLLAHSLSPLRACLASVANEFSQQVASLGLLKAADIARYTQQQQEQQQVRGCGLCLTTALRPPAAAVLCGCTLWHSQLLASVQMRWSLHVCTSAPCHASMGSSSSST
jgi:hypothetical protein